MKIVHNKMEDVDDDPEFVKSFHNMTREYIVFLLLFITLFVFAHFLISLYRTKVSFCGAVYEDFIAYRTGIWICTFALSISIGAALLLPISIVTNEILLFYPGSYYIQFLNTSLIQGLWQIIFLFSNIALFVLLPFAHLFIEAEGFPGSPRGIMSRVHEVVLVLTLLGITIMGLISILTAIYHHTHWSFSFILNMSSFYLPFLYSCVSFFGVLMLLSCTPVGFARLFSVMTDLLLKRKPPVWQPPSYTYYKKTDYDLGSTSFSAEYFTTILPKTDLTELKPTNEDNPSLEEQVDIGDSGTESETFEDEMTRISSLQRNCGYPCVMVVLIFLTTIAVLMVLLNTLLLCFGVKNLPEYSQEIALGISSLSALGPIGAGLEIILILYLWCTSVVGLYSLPFFCRLRPKLHNTSLPQIIGNCSILLILSSALPVLARSLGITNFDLLGDFGRIYWLGNFYIVLFYNVVFMVTAAICLGTKITAAVRREVYQRLCSFAWFRFPRH